MGSVKDPEVDRFAKRLRKRVAVHQLIWFGSRSRGENLRESDYDFVVVSNDFEGIPFPNRAAPLLELWERPQNVDLLCYTPEEFERLSRRITIVREATRRGRAL